MSRKKPPHNEGTIVGIKLQDGYGIGVVARVHGGPHGRRGYGFFGYFYIFSEKPQLSALEGLAPEASIYKAICSDAAIRRGTWEILGQLPGWDRTQWPMLELFRQDRLGDGHLAVRYDPDDSDIEIGSRPISLEEGRKMPEDGSAQAGFVEGELAELSQRSMKAA